MRDRPSRGGVRDCKRSPRPRAIPDFVSSLLQTKETTVFGGFLFEKRGLKIYMKNYTCRIFPEFLNSVLLGLSYEVWL